MWAVDDVVGGGGCRRCGEAAAGGRVVKDVVRLGHVGVVTELPVCDAAAEVWNVV